MTAAAQNETLDRIKASSKFTGYRAPQKRLPKPPLVLTQACQRFSNHAECATLSTRMNADTSVFLHLSGNDVPNLKMLGKFHAYHKKIT